MPKFDLREWTGFVEAGGDPSKPALISEVAIHSAGVTKPGTLFVAFEGERSDGHAYVEEAMERGAAFALVEKGSGLRVPNTCAALQEIAAAYRKQVKAKVIAITGSYGKTLTKDLLVNLLKNVSASLGSRNSQVGVPLSVLGIDPNDDFAVIEVGVSKPGEMDNLLSVVAPDCAILTCVGPAHLGTMGSLEQTEQEKRKLLNAAREWTIDGTNGLVRAISKTGDYEIALDKPLQVHFDRAFPHLPHVLDQVVQAARLLGLSDEEIAKGLEKPLPKTHRTAIWRSPYGPTFVDDSPSPDPLSTERALRLVDEAEELFLFENREIAETQKVKVLQAEDPLQYSGDNRLFIDFAAIRQNLETMQTRSPLAAIVKANAYGTDATRHVRFLASCGVKLFGTARVHEAISLRQAGVTEEIFAIHVAPYEADQVAEWNLQAVVSDRTLIEALEATGKRTRVHLHIDTGMSRLGCQPNRALELAEAIASSDHLELAGVMTHLASADDPAQDAFTRKQLDRFKRALEEIEGAGITIPLKHAASSAAAIRFDIPFCNMTRIGIALFGLHVSEACAKSAQLKPALTLTSRIAAIHTCKKGETVSYGGTYTVEREEEIIGVVPLGYFDGIHRHYSNRGKVLVHGEEAPIVGTVCMDFLMINLTDIPKAALHDQVLIFGEDQFGNTLPAEHFATLGETSVTELITCLGPRIQRIFLY